tara:strand:+ start:21 stop:617 length:597 start_codon:yes stop_codon:yes gene_type:complete
MYTPNEYMDSFDSFCDDTIAINSETGKALKDVVGKQHEEHRYRIYRSAGLDPRKAIHDKRLKAFNADVWVYDKNDNLVIIEESKGHYVDSCFLKRAIGNFAETVDLFDDAGIECPFLVLSSPTTYRLFKTKFERTIRPYRASIQKTLRAKVKYFSLVSSDRLRPNSWLPVASRPIPRTPATTARIQQELNFLAEVRGA